MASMKENIVNSLTWYLEHLKDMFADQDMLSLEFSEANDYVVGDYCIYNNILYQFIEDKEAGEWDDSIVEKSDLGSAITRLNNNMNGYKIRVVDAVPSIPEAETFYCIPEDK